MARVVKKQKKTKNNEKNFNFKILGAALGGLALICGVVFLVIYLQANSIDAKYSNSRQIDYDTLVNEVLENETSRSNYEQTIYVLVFHSDYEEYPNNVFSDSTENKVKSLIRTSLLLNEAYESQDVAMSNRVAFYTLDLMDEDNQGILNNSIFGSVEEGPFIIKIEGTSVKEVKTSSLPSYINTITTVIDENYASNQDK